LNTYLEEDWIMNIAYAESEENR